MNVERQAPRQVAAGHFCYLQAVQSRGKEDVAPRNIHVYESTPFSLKKGPPAPTSPTNAESSKVPAISLGNYKGSLLSQSAPDELQNVTEEGTPKDIRWRFSPVLPHSIRHWRGFDPPSAREVPPRPPPYPPCALTSRGNPRNYAPCHLYTSGYTPTQRENTQDTRLAMPCCSLGLPSQPNERRCYEYLHRCRTPRPQPQGWYYQWC